MNKTIRKETIEEFNEDGKLLRRTITEETTEEDSSIAYPGTINTPHQTPWQITYSTATDPTTNQCKQMRADDKW